MTGDQLKILLDMFTKAGAALPSLLSAIVLIVVMARPVDGSDKLDTIIKEARVNQELSQQAASNAEAAVAAARKNTARLETLRSINSCQIRTLDALSAKAKISLPCTLDDQ